MRSRSNLAVDYSSIETAFLSQVVTTKSSMRLKTVVNSAKKINKNIEYSRAFSVLEKFRRDVSDIFLVYSSDDRNGLKEYPTQCIFTCIRDEGVETELLNSLRQTHKIECLKVVRIGYLSFFYKKHSSEAQIYRIYLFKLTARSLVTLPESHIESLEHYVTRLDLLIEGLIVENTISREAGYSEKSAAIRNLLYYYRGHEDRIWHFLEAFEVDQVKPSPLPCITEKLIDFIIAGEEFMVKRSEGLSDIASIDLILTCNNDEIHDKDYIFRKLKRFIAGYACLLEKNTEIASNDIESRFSAHIQTELLDRFFIRPADHKGFLREVYLGLYVFVLTGGRVEQEWGRLVIDGSKLILKPEQPDFKKRTITYQSKVVAPNTASLDIEIEELLAQH